jgi:hypothetical protein
MRALLPVVLVCLLPSAVLAWDCPPVGDVSIPLPAPAVVKACRAELDGKKQDEVLVGVVRATKKDGKFRLRLFVYTVHEKILVPKFLGTESVGPLVDFGVADLNGDGRFEVLAREGKKTRVYKWEGYGLMEDRELTSKAPDYKEPKAPALKLDFSAAVEIPKLLQERPLTFERTPGRIRRVRVKGNLSNIANRGKYRWLSRAARRHLRKNAFVVVRPKDPYGEFHHVYNENTYLGLPSLITADVALHLTHLLFDHAVQKMEVEVLGPALTRMVKRMRAQAQQLAGKVDQELSKALDRLLLRFQIAGVILDSDTSGLSKERLERIKVETDRILKASGPTKNELGIDYSVYRVRGHYTQSEALRRYFRAYLFLSQPAIGDPHEVALLTALVLSDEDNRKTLAWFEGFGSLLVGPAANQTPLSLQAKAKSLYGEKPSLEKLAAKDPIIRSGRGGETVTLIARRWPADNDVLTIGVDVDQRPFPDPLDLLATLGSARARELLEPQVKKLPGLGPRLAAAAEKFKKGEIGDTASVGGRWLLSLRWLLLDYPKGYASFQRSKAWPTQKLVTAAASWAELRRDTILYVKPPIVWAEGGDEERLPPSRAGYVEPVPELYAELAEVLASLRRGLESFGGKGLGDRGNPRKPDAVKILKNGEELLRFLEEMARKELTGKGLKRSEHETLSSIGGWFEDILAGRGRLDLDPVPVIADVYYFGDPNTMQKQPLLVATGPVDIIVAAVPLGKRVILARGPVFSFYSFVGDRPMNDQEWRKMLEEGSAPEQPPWARPMQMKKRPRMRKRD